MKKPPKRPISPPTQKSHEKKKKKYKIRNWREYNQALVERGSIFFWIEQSAQEAWNKTNKTGRRGKPKAYSDTAIETCRTVRQVFRLSLRAAEGFVNSLLVLMALPLSSPDYSTLSVRGEILTVTIHAERGGDTDETLHTVVDSSGAKVYGEGEWESTTAWME